MALALLGSSVALFAGGWVQFEATTGAARRQLLWLVLGVCSSVPTAKARRIVQALVVPTAVAAAALTLAGATLMGGTSFLAETATVDGQTAAFAHSAAEASLFYAMTLFGTLALSVAASSAGRLPKWYRITATLLGLGMIAGSAGSPLVRGLAFLAGMSTYVFFLVTSVMLMRRGRG